jgi:DNA-binding response OmpR family regulator
VYFQFKFQEKMKKNRILYAEDDETLAFLTTDSLEEQGFEVFCCNDGLACVEAFNNQSFDLCLLDIMMPKMSGFEVATKIRKKNSNIPILFLSAKTLKDDRIFGLKIGADDYLVKPFSMEELILKINIFLRRSTNFSDEKSHTMVGNFVFDVDNLSLKSNENIINLTQREADLLQLFLKNKNKILKREFILESLWGENDYFMGRSLDVFVSRLRKIFSSHETIFIENIHGVGFKFTERIN